MSSPTSSSASRNAVSTGRLPRITAATGEADLATMAAHLHRPAGEQHLGAVRTVATARSAPPSGARRETSAGAEPIRRQPVRRARRRSSGCRAPTAGRTLRWCAAAGGSPAARPAAATDARVGHESSSADVLSPAAALATIVDDGLLQSLRREIGLGGRTPGRATDRFGIGRRGLPAALLALVLRGEVGVPPHECQAPRRAGRSGGGRWPRDRSRAARPPRRRGRSPRGRGSGAHADGPAGTQPPARSRSRR